MSDRGMKKWAPYKSLNEQEYFMEQMRESRSRIEKPIISEDLAEEINQTLTNATNETLLIFRFYKNGHIYEIEQYIKEIDLINRIIHGSELNLKIDDIVFAKEK